MNIEFEVKSIIGNGGTFEEKAEKICAMTNFSKDKVIEGLSKGGETIADVYWNIILEDRK